MGEKVSAGSARMRILCILNDATDAGARRWIDALSRDHEVEIVALDAKAFTYAELVDRIFAADRVISW